jgi:hypothetical protein
LIDDVIQHLPDHGRVKATLIKLLFLMNSGDGSREA